MNAKQGKIAVLATVLVLSILLFHEARSSGEWVGFAVTEVQILVPMSISWWVMTAKRKPYS